MMILQKLWIIFLPIAGYLAWRLYFYDSSISLDENKEKTSKILSNDYFSGLNYLVTEQSDKALDVFVRLFSADSETVEIHFALGSLFRRRGELDRAIRIHENLIARPNLTVAQRGQAMLALGEDYMYAGLLDRAENIFQQAIKFTEKDEQTRKAYERLLEIYQQQSAWQQAIDAAIILQKKWKFKLNHAIAHFYCELAEIAITNQQHKQALKKLENAIVYDPKCVRANLQKAELFIEQHKYNLAIENLKQVEFQDVNYIAEVFPKLTHCYVQLQQVDELINYLQHLLKKYAQPSIAICLAELLYQINQHEQAMNVLLTQIHYFPSLSNIKKIIEWIDTSPHPQHERTFSLKAVANAITDLIDDKNLYQCMVCNFSAKKNFWHCPRCKHWNSAHSIEMIKRYQFTAEQQLPANELKFFNNDLKDKSFNADCQNHNYLNENRHDINQPFIHDEMNNSELKSEESKKMQDKENLLYQKIDHPDLMSVNGKDKRNDK